MIYLLCIYLLIGTWITVVLARVTESIWSKARLPVIATCAILCVLLWPLLAIPSIFGVIDR